jgi:hypothetical protein
MQNFNLEFFGGPKIRISVNGFRSTQVPSGIYRFCLVAYEDLSRGDICSAYLLKWLVDHKES